MPSLRRAAQSPPARAGGGQRPGSRHQTRCGTRTAWANLRHGLNCSRPQNAECRPRSRKEKTDAQPTPRQ
eukprot:1664868-Lingulodinium_polyedra.AAC.1